MKLISVDTQYVIKDFVAAKSTFNLEALTRNFNSGVGLIQVELSISDGLELRFASWKLSNL